VKTSKQMQSIIGKIAAKHGVELTKVGSHLTLTMPGYDRLAIETVGVNQVSVAHYFEQNGDLIADPEIVFFTGYGPWVPIALSLVVSGWREVARLSADGSELAYVELAAQADAASLARMWAKNLREQGWLERATPRS
jgi:hypothetical protein